MKNCECGCDIKTDVKNSRVFESENLGLHVRRRRECVGCKRRFTTYEISGEVIENALKASVILAALKNLLEESDL